jgi:hypothetical protein
MGASVFSEVRRPKFTYPFQCLDLRSDDPNVPGNWMMGPL